jgi:hypothetical protein
MILPKIYVCNEIASHNEVFRSFKVYSDLIASTIYKGLT